MSNRELAIITAKELALKFMEQLVPRISRADWTNTHHSEILGEHFKVLSRKVFEAIDELP